MPDIDFDVVHTPEATLVRVYYRDDRDALVPMAEISLPRGADFPKLYDTFRREHGWPTVDEVETLLLPRLTGTVPEREDLSEVERKIAASRDMAGFFKTWLLLHGRGKMLRVEEE